VIVKKTGYFNSVNESHDTNLEEALASQQNNTYITAEFVDSHVPTTFELGDGNWYGDYMNRPLEPAVCYQTAIRIMFIKKVCHRQTTLFA